MYILGRWRMKMILLAERLIICFYAVSLHVFGICVQGDWLACGGCKCKWNSGKKTGDCRNISLESVPEYLHSDLQVLDLSLNQISVVEEDAFLKSSLQNLHKLFIRNCSLELILPNGLRGLEILIELDLSNNLMKSLPRDVFASLVKLRSLILNNNLIDSLQNGLFRNLEYLKKVELKENRLVSIGMEVFVNVPVLSQIFLSGNKLSFLRKETFAKLDHLQSLSLELNPWNCTCELQDFREFVLRQNLYTPPTSCHAPSQLRGMFWNDNQTVPFACAPQIIYPPRGTSINTSKENVTLTCRVHTSPSTLINWEYNKQIYLGNYQRVHIQSIRDEKRINASDRELGREWVTSRLTIVGAERSDEGQYACVALNPAGRDEVEMRLLVAKHSHQSILIQNNLIIVICLMALGLLSASIFLAMITCCIYKKFRAINHRVIEEQQLQQKRNFVNGVNGVNESFNCAGGNSELGYMEIKAMKLQSDHVGNGDVSKLKDLIGLDTSQENNHENSVKGLVSHQSTIIGGELLPNQRKTVIESNTNEYQPDLLPYMSQAVSLSHPVFHNYSSSVSTSPMTNSSIVCDNQQTGTYCCYQQGQQINQLHPYRSPHFPPLVSNDLSYTQQYAIQRTPQQRRQLEEDDEITDTDVEGVNNMVRCRQSGQQHFGIFDIPCSTRATLIPASNGVPTANKGENVEQPFLPIGHNVTSKHSIVRSSPSLNFLSNCHLPRRELL